MNKPGRKILRSGVDPGFDLFVWHPKGQACPPQTKNAFTRLINTRNRLWGHLFGGRYKSILVEPEAGGGGDYLTTLIDYIHLKPVRAGLVDGVETSLLDYPWSSVAQAYGKSPGKRPGWMAAGEGLDLCQEKDTAKGRRGFVERLDQWAASESAEKVGLVEREEQSFQSTLRRGWYWGSESFRETLVERFGGSIAKDKDRELRSSDLFKSRERQEADEIVSEAEHYFGESMEELRVPKYGDLRKVALTRAWGK